MSYQVLARKWRPKTFQEVVGQEAVVQALVNGLDNDRVHHAFLLTGTRGRFKVYIIDEVHMLSTSSFNALLKTLEEPPPHVKFVLATTDAERIPVTILSRCLRFNLRRLLPEQIREYLEMILASEQVEAEAAAVERIARAADGSMRDGLSLLDQAIAYGGGALRDDEVAHMLGSVDHAHLTSLIRAVAEDDADTILEIVRELAAQARNLESVLTGIAEVLHRVSLLQCAPEYRDPERSDWESVAALAEVVSPEDAQLYYQIAVQSARDLGIAPDPRTGLEMALLRMLAFRPVEPGGAVTPAAQAPEKKVASQAPATAPAAGQGAVAAEPAPAAAPGGEAEQAEPDLFAGPQAQPAPAAAVETGGSGDDWHGLLDRLELSGPVKELARNIRLQSRSGDRWEFLIPDSVRHLGSKAIIRKLQSALSTQLGQPVDLALHTARQPVVTPAVVSDNATRERLSEAERAIERDPTVQSLKERMDARVVEDSIQPLQ